MGYTKENVILKSPQVTENSSASPRLWPFITKKYAIFDHKIKYLI